MSTAPISPLTDLPVHQGIDEWTAAALTGGFSTPEERRQFEDHLAGCAECRERFAEDTAMSQTIQHAFTAALPRPGFENRLTAAFRQRRGAAWGERFRLWAGALAIHPAARALGAVAGVAMLVFIGENLTHELPGDGADRSTRGMARRIVNDARIGDGPNAVAALTDGMTSNALAFDGRDSQGTLQLGLETGKDLGSAKQPFRLAGGNTYTGATTVTAGTLSIGGVVTPPSANSYAINGGTFLRTSTGSGSADSHDFGFSVKEARRADAGAYRDQKTNGENGLQQQMAAQDSDVARNGKPASQTVPPVAAPVVAPAVSSAPAAPAAPQPPPAPAAPPAETRKLIRNANVDLEVAAFDPALDALGAAAAQVGQGYIATVNSSRLPNGKRRGAVVIKVLPDQLDAFLARLRGLGEVKSQTVSTEDVTKAYFDTDARLRNARRMEDRLLKLLDEAKGKLNEILQVEKELARVREDIEKMQGELKLYDALVRYATVTLNLYEKDLQQPAAFLLRQTAELALLTADVEKTYGEARRAAQDTHAQIVASDLVRASDGRVSATLRLLFTADAADGALARIKALARVQTFNVRDERIAQNGGGGADDAKGDAKLERGPVTLNLSINHDEETHRRVSATLSAANPSGAFDQVRAAGVAAGAEVVNASFNRTRGVHGNGSLVLRVPASKEAGLLDAVHAAGRTSDFSVQRDNNAAPDADAAPTLLTLNVTDEPVHRRVSLTLIAPDLDGAFDKARAAASAAGGEIASSSFNHPQGGHGSASLELLLPGKSEAAVLEAIRALGRSVNFNVQRDAGAAGESDTAAPGPVSLTVNFADEEPAVQQTHLAVLSPEVGKRQEEARRLAASAGAQVRSSSFERGSDERETANLVFRLPLRAYPGFMERLQALGEVKGLDIHRQDRPEAVATGAEDSAPAEVSLELYSQGRFIADESGVGATIRRTLAQGVGALMWSLRMIGVALAFLAPWAAAAILAIWLTRVVSRRRRTAIRKADDASN